MINVFPNYYKNFRCIAGKCKHNCCIGWEIDVDEDTTSLYQTVSGEMGMRINECISLTPEPHFILSENERCPFLNEHNLCDIITELGEGYLCEICNEHPRFHNYMPDRVESGLGLCCEAAAELILGQVEPMSLEFTSSPYSSDEIIILRDNIISILQNRNISVAQRLTDVLKIFNTDISNLSTPYWVDFLFSLERLDDSWTKLLELIKKHYKHIDFDEFDRHIMNRQTEYEQLSVYFIYRHFANACDMTDAAVIAVFVVLAYNVLYALGAAIYYDKGSFSFEDNVDISRMFSSEIEYSDENLCKILDKIKGEILNV